MEKKKRLDENKSLFLGAAAILAFVLLVTIGGMVFFKQQVRQATRALEETEYREYDRYYAMIVEDADSSFWQEVYAGACVQAEENNVCVELLNDTLEEEYSREELMHIAIESQVDGIIVQADEGEELTACIDEAVEKGIPVITVLGDNTSGHRQSFVGVGSYNLGREYGKQVIEIYRNKEPVSGKVYVLMDTKAEDSSQNILYSGIQETLENLDISLEMYAVNNESRFSVEESIRDIFMNVEEQPDIIICLDELNTSCVYQAVVDYNRVGEVGIIGYYDSRDILRAIERKVIHSTITVDTAQMGSYCVEALSEFDEVGNVSEYFTVDVHLVNADNVAAYLEQEEAADEK